MRRFSLLLAVLLLGGACGTNDGDSPGAAGDTTSTTVVSSPSPAPTGSETAGTTDYEVWFAYGESLFFSRHSERTMEAAARTAIELLLAGPSSQEDAAGVTTLIPEGTELRDLSLEDGVATVDLSSEFDDGGGSLSMQMRLAQVVYTATQFQTVKGVEFRLDGEPVETFSGEGIVLDGPQTRKDYEPLLPAILVEHPLVGDRVSSPVTVSGTANTFEATVGIRILDADGKKLKETFTTATCGTGCRGDYTKDVSFTVTEEQPGYIEVYESSAEDGSDTKLVRIPVTLEP